MSEQIDFVTRSYERLPSQYKQSTNMIAWLGLFMKQCNDLEQASQDIQSLRYLPVAQGDQLDGLGEIIGESRAFDAAVRYFGMKDNPAINRAIVTLDDGSSTGTIFYDGSAYPIGIGFNGDAGAPVGARYHIQKQAISSITGVQDDIEGGSYLIWDGSVWTNIDDSTLPIPPTGGFGDETNIGGENPEPGTFADERYGVDGTQRFILTDTEYRGLLQAKIIWNHSKCTDEDVIKTIQYILHDPTVRVVIQEDLPNLTVTITIEKILTSREKLILLSPKAPIPRAGGVLYILEDSDGPI